MKPPSQASLGHPPLFERLRPEANCMRASYSGVLRAQFPRTREVIHICTIHLVIGSSRKRHISGQVISCGPSGEWLLNRNGHLTSVGITGSRGWCRVKSTLCSSTPRKTV
ncbi:hypothetical protein PoB_007598800 [Plakobranchus ocellatus]|uniref:Uncharacterized protein n=1 Tax=Plakobranchus ocellatus TaxID=259542 RepID=A0AAV4DYP7_9GAST|nr:hypothetical protein PoB_007598800 [Plakobranchus ocellatus]